MDERELLDVGEEHSRTSRGARIGVACAVLLAAAGVAADRRLLQQEEEAVARCAEVLEGAVVQAGRRVQATYEYVRPAVTTTADRRLENGLYQLVAESAVGADDRLRTVREDCAGVRVLPHHREAAERLDRCMDVVDGQRAALAGVARDGATVMAWLDLPRRC